MGKQYRKLSDADIAFIEAQKLFYIASCSDKEVNLSPKGYDTIRILDDATLLFLSYPGSGNRTYRDAMNDGEFTLVFNAFEGAPQILRLFCKAQIVTQESEAFDSYLSLFNIGSGVVRNLFTFSIYAVESSCGMSVPVMEYIEDRDALKDWARDMHRSEKLEGYMQKHHQPIDLKEIRGALK